jgi:hypothetical protein
VAGYYYHAAGKEEFVGCPQHLGEGKKSGSRAPSVSGTQDSDDRMSIKEVQPFLPVYTGGPNVAGFVKKFEKILEEGHMSDGRKYVALLGQIKGAADQWLQRQPDWESWTYQEVLAALKKHFGQIQDTAVARLEQMQYKDDLVKFNADFTKIGSGVVDKCSEYM